MDEIRPRAQHREGGADATANGERNINYRKRPEDFLPQQTLGERALITVAGQPVPVAMLIAILFQTIAGLWATFAFINRVDNLNQRLVVAEKIDERRNEQFRSMELTIQQISNTVEREGDRQQNFQNQLNSLMQTIGQMGQRGESNERRLIRIEERMNISDRASRLHEDGTVGPQHNGQKP